MLPQRLADGDSGLTLSALLSDRDNVRRSESEARLPLLPGRGAAVVPIIPLGGLAKCGTAMQSGVDVGTVVMLPFRMSA